MNLEGIDAVQSCMVRENEAEMKEKEHLCKVLAVMLC